MVGIAALLIRRDGGPVVFKQMRIGEGGKPIMIYKLRTMASESTATRRVGVANDAARYPIGRFLRRTHLDERRSS